MEEEYRKNSNFYQYINIVESRVPCAPPTIQCRYESGIHEFDRAMANFPSGLAQDLIVEILISKVRVKRTRRGFATHTDKRHHGISADLLAIKWGVGIYKSKRTLQLKTQDNVRSALKPLTRRYRTDFLLQRIRRLNIFYADTLFEKDKSIAGNTCAHIFTDGEFFK